MNQQIKFHCSIESNFKIPGQIVRAFTYHNYAIEAHMHDFYEINIVMSGTGYHNIDNNTISVKSGDVFVIPPLTVHSYANTQALNVYHILIKPEFINALLLSDKDDGLKILLKTEPILRRNISKSLFLKLNAKQMLLIKSDLDALSEECIGNYPANPRFQTYTVLKLLSWFSDLIQKQQDRTADSESLYEKKILDVLNFIYENYAENISVTDLCRVANMSKATLFRNFKEYCGSTPMEFVRQQRKVMALTLLENGDYSKTRIAQECGFYDLSHMDKTIKGK